ncbi:hypothetical protein [Actinoallomurus soli]|uniref:hypothetical protein n=1 Tax=Actinoallomurus soli TaxID=2952535 RepID=UPI0020925BCA|nr:hypothetical protein [Actinoallomurus soli]MCO5974119.1 hypothetical protein [Actinoallomurus soli]
MGTTRHHTIRTALTAVAAVPALLLGTTGVAVAASAGTAAHPGNAIRATGQVCSPSSAQRHDGDSSCFRRCDLACHKRTGGPSPYCKSTCKKQCGIS